MKFDWITIGNVRAVEFLDKSLSNGQIANFYIFAGIPGLGKFSLAKNFIKNIFLKDDPNLIQLDNFLETNSDFFIIEKEKDRKNISIDQIRGLIERLKSTSFLNSYRAAIVKDAHNLNDNSSNALLKILEEKNHKTIIILTVNDVDNLPKTIISRGQVINFFPVKDDLIYKNLIDNFGASPSLAKNLTRLSMGRPVMALKFFQDENIYQDYQSLVFDFLEFLPSNFSQRVQIINNTINKGNILENFNILEVWQSIIRDLIFIDFGQYDYVRNDFAMDQLKSIKKDELGLSRLREKSIIIDEGLKFSLANINFKSVLEYVAVNI